jgi:hypothetical protein
VDELHNEIFPDIPECFPDARASLPNDVSEHASENDERKHADKVLG